MVTEGNFILDGEHTMQHTYEGFQPLKYYPKLYMLIIVKCSSYLEMLQRPQLIPAFS